MILVGGANVYPAEVEAAILGASPLVRACAVIGLPDGGGDMGNRVHAIVDTGDTPLEEPARSALLDALQAHVEKELTPYKRPRSIELHAGLPLRDDAGKMRRAELRQMRMNV